MRICIVADSSRAAIIKEEREPEGCLSFFFIERVAEDSKEALPRADLHVLPAHAFLDLKPGERPALAMAYGRPELMAECFRAGCADYLREPWELPELKARALRFMRARLRVGGSVLEIREKLLSCGGKSLELGEEEYLLARILILNLNRCVPRPALEYAAWGSERPGSRALDVQISTLRKKMSTLIPAASGALRACRGSGYRLEGESCG